MSLGRFVRLFGLGTAFSLGAGYFAWRRNDHDESQANNQPIIMPTTVEEIKFPVRVVNTDPNYNPLSDYVTYWMSALKENGLFLRHIPHEFVTEDMIIEAFNQNPKALEYFIHIPDTPKLISFYEKIVNENILNLVYCSNTFKISHPDLCQKLFDLDYHYYSSLPDEAITDKIKREYIALSGRLELVKEKSIDYYAELLKKNVLILRHSPHDVPENLREAIIARLPEDTRKKAKFLLTDHYKLDWTTCKDVLDLDPTYLDYVPEYFWRDNNEIINYVKKDPSLIKIIISVFDIYVDTRERYDRYGKINGHRFTSAVTYDVKVGKLIHNPKVLKFYARIVAEVVHEHPASLAYVNNERLFNTLLDENLALPMWEEAVSKNGMLLRHVPSMIRTKYPTICAKALAQNPMAMEYIPQNQLSKEKCEEAFARNPLCYTHIPKTYLTKAMSERAVLVNPMLIEKVPVEHQSELMWIDAAIHNPNVLTFRVDHNSKYLTTAVYMAALSKNHDAFHNIPAKYKTPSMCEMVVKENALKYYGDVPDNLKTEAMTLAYIISFSANERRPDLEKVPLDLRTQKVCDLAFARNIANYAFIPDDKKTAAMNKIYATVYPNKVTMKMAENVEPERSTFRRI